MPRKLKRGMRKNMRFYCFSPFVMLSTVVVEVALALFVIAKYRRSPIFGLSITLLLLLATFQMAEYGICREVLFSGDVWGRIGFVAITLLPAVGVHLMQTLRQKKTDAITIAAYATAGVWVLLFSFGDVIQSYQCTTNYLVFSMESGYGGAYFMYYYAWLVTTIVSSFMGWKARELHATPLLWLIIGYLSFIVPATVIWLLDGPAARGLPSIMCGFAVLFALVLAFKVVPSSLVTTPSGKTKQKKVK